MSKFLSLVLRHRPELIDIELDHAGWVDVDLLLLALARNGRPIDRTKLTQIVANDRKNRYAFSEDGRRIRANQGHSVPVELGYSPSPPPALLYHGTPLRNWSAISEQGLQRRNRHHVHLSPDQTIAIQVGQRRGAAVILVIDAAAMHRAGHVFFRSANGVWLTEAVPPEYIALAQ